MPALIVLVLQEVDIELKLELQEVACKKCLKDKRGRKMIRMGKLSDLQFRSNICEMENNGHKTESEELYMKQEKLWSKDF